MKHKIIVIAWILGVPLFVLAAIYFLSWLAR